MFWLQIHTSLLHFKAKPWQTTFLLCQVPFQSLAIGDRGELEGWRRETFAVPVCFLFLSGSPQSGSCGGNNWLQQPQLAPIRSFSTLSDQSCVALQGNSTNQLHTLPLESSKPLKSSWKSSSKPLSFNTFILSFSLCSLSLRDGGCFP